MGSTSVAHSGFAFRSQYCSGRYPATAYTGSITYQAAIDGGDGIGLVSRVDDLNLYGDGNGDVYGVPVDGRGARYRGVIADSFPHDIDIPCLASQSNNVRLIPMASAPGATPEGDDWLGRWRWTSFGLSGNADVEPETTVLTNLVRASFTSTDAALFPVSYLPSNNPLRSPPEGYAGAYSAHLIGNTGVDRQIAGWIVTDSTATGPVTFGAGQGDDVECSLTFSHSPVETQPFPDTDTGYEDPNENFRNVVGDITACNDGGALGVEGAYNGIMIYQPMTVAGDPDENGLEVILTPSDPEHEQHMLWFLLRQ